MPERHTTQTGERLAVEVSARGKQTDKRIVKAKNTREQSGDKSIQIRVVLEWQKFKEYSQTGQG